MNSVKKSLSLKSKTEEKLLKRQKNDKNFNPPRNVLKALDFLKGPKNIRNA